MAVYDRSMFRGSRPTPQAQGAGDAVAEKFVSEVGNRVVSDAQQGIASAKDYVQVMNAMRGDQQTMKERRSELGGIVGMKDANKTPESVVTLVQPVMQMREAQGSVDDGIGQMAQKAMDIPVEGKMAGGIMQPIQMQTGGAASLKRLYQENLPMMREIYGDQSADLKKQALGQLLLGGVAPAGLAIAQGTPVAEALMAVGPYAAQLAGGVSEAKRKQDAAERSGAFELAQAEQKRIRDARAKAAEPIKVGRYETVYGPPDPETGERPVIAQGVGETFKPVTLMNTAGQFETAFTIEDENRIRNEGFVLPPSKPEAFSPVSLANQAGEVKTATSLTEEADMRRQGFVLPPSKTEKYTPKSLANQAGEVRTATSVQEETTMRQEGFVLTPEKIGVGDMKIVYRRGENGGLEARAANASNLESLLAEGYTPNTPENFQFVRMVKVQDGKPVVSTAKSIVQQNKLIEQGYRPYSEELKVFGNQLLSVTPVGTSVVATQEDPATLFNEKGQPRVVKNDQEALSARKEGFHFTSKPELKGMSSSFANALLVDLADEISSGTANEEQIRQFQSAVTVVRDTPRITTGAGGEGLVTAGGTVPPFVVDAVRMAKERNPEFNDMGLLATQEDAPIDTPADYEGIIDPTINYAESIGPRAKFGRGVGNVADFLSALFSGADYEPTNTQSFEGARDLQYLNTITVTRALNAVGGKDTEGLRARIEALQVDPYSAGLTKTKLKSSVDNMLSFLRDNKIKLEKQKDDAPTVQIRAKKRDDIDEMDYLISQYEILQRNLQGQAGSFGSNAVSPQDAPSLSGN